MHLRDSPLLHLLVFFLIAFASFTFFRFIQSRNINQTAPTANMKSAEFKVYNRLAEHMSYYHSILRANWDELYAGSAPASKASAASVIRVGIQFCNHLKAHHDIEESMWFPVLARKMPGFRDGEFAKSQHKEMHKGLDVLQPYLIDCKAGVQDFRRDRVRSIMDSFATVLWNHMDEEVRELEAESMSKYWTLDEMKRMPF